MYIMNRRPKPRRRGQTIVVSMLLLGLFVGGGVAAQQYMDSSSATKISGTPPPVVTKVLGDNTKTRSFTAGPASISLPQDWEQFTPANAAAGSYSWRNTTGNKGVRVITMYIDVIPKDMAVNRVLAVQGDGDRIIPLGSVSDNCVNFSGDGKPGAGNGRMVARWESVQFNCDTGNYVRNVVGTSSEDGPNVVRVGGSSGTHQLFLTYNDANANPNFSIFTSAIQSIRLH